MPAPTLSKSLPDSPFLPDSHIQFAWDSTSLGTALVCPRQYQYKIIQGYVDKNPNVAIALDFGILFHKGLEIYHRELASGKDRNESLQIALTTLPQHPRYANLPTEKDIENLASEFKTAAASDSLDDDGITLRNSKIRTRYHLMRALVWYVSHYTPEGGEDQFKTLIVHEQPAVEVSFRVPTPLEIEGSSVVYCGHIDRAVEFNDRYYVTDHKTTKSLTSQFFSSFELSHQFTGYTYAGNIIFDKPISGAMIDGIALLVGGAKFARAPTYRTDSQIEEWLKTLNDVIQRFTEYHDQKFYPQNTGGCYFCEYKGICAQPPEYRAAYLAQKFKQVPAWNPLENR